MQSLHLAQSLQGPFDLATARKPEAQHFRMETLFIHIGFDGKRTSRETYTLKLRCAPASR